VTIRSRERITVEYLLRTMPCAVRAVFKSNETWIPQYLYDSHPIVCVNTFICSLRWKGGGHRDAQVVSKRGKSGNTLPPFLARAG
jgi:hypothetical protein